MIVRAQRILSHLSERVTIFTNLRECKATLYPPLAGRIDETMSDLHEAENGLLRNECEPADPAPSVRVARAKQHGGAGPDEVVCGRGERI
jgi:hypothetical protein